MIIIYIHTLYIYTHYIPARLLIETSYDLLVDGWAAMRWMMTLVLPLH